MAATTITDPRYAPTRVQLYLRADKAFTRLAWGRRVKAAGGSYTDIRGNCDTRFVTLHIADNVELIDELLAAFSYVQLRGRRGTTAKVSSTAPRTLPAWVTMQNGNTLAELIDAHAKAWHNAVDRGIVKPKTATQLDAEAVARQQVTDQQARDTVKRDELVARVRVMLANDYYADVDHESPDQQAHPARSGFGERSNRVSLSLDALERLLNVASQFNVRLSDGIATG